MKMQGESLTTNVERFHTLLFYQLYAQLPRPGGIHKYSKGALIRGFKSEKLTDGYLITISENVPYARYAMGYNDSGGKRQPRGQLEKINFKTIENCINQVSNIVAKSTGGNVE